MGSLIAILMASEVAHFYFLDGDESGLIRAQRYTKDFDLKGLTTKEFSNQAHSSLEDLIPRKTYLQAVKSAYSLSELTIDENSTMITQQVSKFLKDKGLGRNDKVKITEKLLPLLSGISEEICNTFEPIFTRINEIKKNGIGVL